MSKCVITIFFSLCFVVNWAQNPFSFSDKPLILYGIEDTTSNLIQQIPDSSLTSLIYLSAGKKFQAFSLKHYNLNNRLPFRFSYRRFYSAGYFRNSAFRNGMFEFSTQKSTTRFQWKFSGKYLNAFRNDFAGVSPDSLLLLPNYEPLQVPVNVLESANNVKFRYSDINLRYALKDSGVVFLGAKGNWLRKVSNYTDVISTDFYANTYFDAFNSNDSTLLDSVSISPVLGFITKKTDYELAVGNLYYHFLSDSINDAYNNNYITAQIKRTTKHGKWNVSANYFFNGYFSESFFIHSRITQQFKKHTFGIDYAYRYALPAIHYLRYASNHFIYNYNFGFIAQHKASVAYQYKNIKLKYYSESAKNKMYYDYYAYPKQYQSTLWLQQIQAQYTDTLKRFLTDVSVAYTYTSDAVVFPRSPLTSNISSFYMHRLFKGKLQSKIGVRLRYFAPFYALKYMPATRVYYIQNETKTGGYPLVDVEWNVTLKRFDLLLRVNNLLDRMDNTVWYVIPGYPLWKRNFQIGMKWDMYN